MKPCLLCNLRYVSWSAVRRGDGKPPPDPTQVPKTEIKDIASNIEQIASSTDTKTFVDPPAERNDEKVISYSIIETEYSDKPSLVIVGVAVGSDGHR